MPLSILSSALVAAIVGFGGTVALIIAAAHAVGANTAQTASWIAALCLALAVSSVYLSWRYRMPVITAWSTPGAALIGSTGGNVAFEYAVGAFLLTAVLILITAAVRPLARLIEKIPLPLAAAMLAGVLLQLVLAVFTMVPHAPWLVLPLVALFFLVRTFSAAWAVLIVLIAGVALCFAFGQFNPPPALEPGTLTLLNIAWPRFDPAVLIGLGLPLYLVTMASQNLPGLAVLRACGYEPPVRPILAVTGLASLLTAPLGAHTSNLAAITAALCTGPETHPDPAQRWRAGVAYGAIYFAIALTASSVVALFAALPAALIATVAGLGLLGPLFGALGNALAVQHGDGTRFAALVCFVVTGSGTTLLGIGAAFWGLLIGLVVLQLGRLRPAA